MRKLNTKNKTIISVLSILAILIFILVLIFISLKIKEYNIKYVVSASSQFFNSDRELVTTESNTYAKKSLSGNYYVMINDKKENVTQNAVIYEKTNSLVKLLGTYYEIKNNGEVNKIKNENNIEITKPKLYKISDRKYLIIASVIKSSDDSLKTTDYLLINIDKVGNAYLYNNEVNIKTFNELSLITESFVFNVNEEKMIINGEEIDLAKINGSTNTYKKHKAKDDNQKENENHQDEALNNSASEKIVNEPSEVQEENLKKVINEQILIKHKTSILNTTSSINNIKIDYLVSDPLNEYNEVYVELYEENNLIQKYNLNATLNEYTIDSLKPSTSYLLKFYYSYTENNQEHTKLFDFINVTTKDIKASISLEKVSSYSVRYIMKVDGIDKLDQCDIKLYIDDNEVGQENNINILNSKYVGTIELLNKINSYGTIAKLSLENCIYAGKNISAQYKFKI